MPRLRNHLTRSVNAARYIRVGVGFWARTTSFVCEATHTTTLCLHLRTPCVMIGADLLGGGRGLGFSRWPHRGFAPSYGMYEAEPRGC
jgi:hypothetical protein